MPAEAILRSMSVLKNNDVHPQYKNVFFLLPAGQRVSFGTQQIRALNFTWALAQSRGFENRSRRIAIVGAGVAGVTCACALAALGYQVTLFEEAATPMWRQKSTRHRFVHPMINQWPLGQGAMADLLPVTQFPFLNWYYSCCDEAIRALDRDFQFFMSFLPYHLSVQTKCRVAEFYHANVNNNYDDDGGNDRGSDEVKITLRTSADETYRDYDFLVFTTGFSKESCPLKGEEVQDYWKADELERSLARGATKSYIISGAGDGGLIDALRIAYSKFDYGQLTYKIARLVSEHAPEVCELIADAEAHKASLPRDEAYPKVAELIRKDERYRAIKDCLLSALAPEPPELFLADTEYEYPWSSRAAAPIHKLMLAFAISTKGTKINYFKGKVNRTGGKAVDKQYTIGTSARYKKDSLHIPRVGARRNYAGFLSDSQVIDYEMRISEPADYNAVPYFDGRDRLVFKNLPPAHDPQKPEFWSSRRALIEKAWRQLDPDATVCLEDDTVWINSKAAGATPPKLFDLNIRFGSPKAPDIFHAE